MGRKLALPVWHKGHTRSFVEVYFIFLERDAAVKRVSQLYCAWTALTYIPRR